MEIKSKEIKVSILMGIYNCADTLSESIESILNQTFQEYELILCDDGSKDDTYDIAKEYQKKYKHKIVLLKNDKNRGLNYTLNKCLKNAKGEYIARQDGDDISLSNRLKREYDFLESNSQYDIVSCPMIYFDEYGDWGKGKVISEPQVKDFVRHTPFFCHAPCMIRKKAILSVGGYTVDKKLLRYEDCDLWYKMYAKGFRGYNLQEPLYKMRDDRNAANRRTFESRIRIIYVMYRGFKMVHMPRIYYLYLPVIFVKNFILALLPKNIYEKIHKIRQRKVE